MSMADENDESEDAPVTKERVIADLGQLIADLDSLIEEHGDLPIGEPEQGKKES
ncbi:MAG: hypothetical protein AB1591_02605 [Pseudomonadota bacterium]